MYLYCYELPRSYSQQDKIKTFVLYVYSFSKYKSPIQQVLMTFFSGAKRAGCDAENISTSDVKDKERLKLFPKETGKAT